MEHSTVLTEAMKSNAVSFIYISSSIVFSLFSVAQYYHYDVLYAVCREYSVILYSHSLIGIQIVFKGGRLAVCYVMLAFLADTQLASFYWKLV